MLLQAAHSINLKSLAMKKMLSLGLTLALSIAGSGLLHAQITETGTKVGINNTSPDATLDVKGNDGTLLEVKAVSAWVAPIGEGSGPATFFTPDFAFKVVHQNNPLQGSPPVGFARVFTIEPNGNTQIGTFPANPGEKLSVAGDVALYNSTNDWTKLRYPGGSGELRWKSTQGRTFSIVNDNSGTKGFTMAPDGKVGIGTDNLSNDFNGSYEVFIQGATLIRAGSSPHSLYVEGSMVFEEGYVKLKAGWPDYVFDNDYVLMPLSDVAGFINTHGRLPGMPSAEQVAEEGLALGETQRLLTEKVEELTLYLLQMNKEIEALREEITTLKVEK
jgi:hypothetical protein